jgi:hypothetical protein
MKPFAILPLLGVLAACASPAKQGGFLSSYENLAPRPGAVRADIAERKDAGALAAISRVRLEPTQLVDPDASWLSDDERRAVLREADAQLCFELSKRYELVDEGHEARVRAAITRIRPTGRIGSAASAAAAFFIPGPIGVRVPGTLGGLGAEAEMVSADGRQLAAMTWNRSAMPVGTDNPSLSRIGDALQLAAPFADATAKAFSAPGAKARRVGNPDPCAQFGSRFRPEGWAARFVTKLYVPQMSGAKPAQAEPEGAEP